MPVTKNWAYFDHAAVGALPSPTSAVITSWCAEATEQGDTAWPAWSRGVSQTRRSAAELINAAPGEIALVPSTTAGICLVAEGYPWKAGDNVVTLANEFPSNLYPWLNLAERGVETRRVPVDRDGRVHLDRILAACDEHTRIVAVSWIGFATGFRIDLARFVDAVHSRGALFCLDAIQGVGVFPLDVKDIPLDFMAADGHKWMLGPEGAGLFYVRQEHLELLRPFGVGWHSVENCFDFSRVDFKLKNSASRYEGGTMNAVGFLGLGASLRFLQQFGITPQSSPIADRIVQITDYAVERLTEIGWETVSIRESDHRSGIVSFKLDDRDLDAVRQTCLQSRIVLSHRNGWLRISPHAYNNEQEIDELVDVLQHTCAAQ